MASVAKRTWVHAGEKRTAWVVRYTDPAGRQRLKTCPSKKDADRERLRIETELGAGIHTAASATVTFAHAVDQWLRDCDRRWKIGDHMTGTTYASYRQYVKSHLEGAPFRNRKMIELQHLELQDFVNDKASRHTWQTTAKIAVVIKQTFKFAVARRWIVVNPLVSQPLRVPGRKRSDTAIPNKQEIEKILRALAKREPREKEQAYRMRVAIVVLGLFAGLRRGEVCGLQWENVDLERGIINVRHSFSQYDGLKGPKTAAGVRSVPMSQPVWSVLQWLADLYPAGVPSKVRRARQTGERTGFVLLTVLNNHVPPQSMWRYFKAVLTKAGLVDERGAPRFTFHALRHTAASLFIEQGLDAFRLKGIIGHESVSTTMDIYGHLFPDDGTGRKAITGAAAQFDLAGSAPALRLARPSVRQGSDNAL